MMYIREGINSHKDLKQQDPVRVNIAGIAHQAFTTEELRDFVPCRKPETWLERASSLERLRPKCATFATQPLASSDDD